MKPTAYRHQDEEFLRTRDFANWALWWDQGTGKSRVIIDTAVYLYQEGKIDAVLVVAPGGVEANWIVDEFPTHADVDYFPALWSTKKKKTKIHRQTFEDLFNHDGLKVMAISYDALMTDDGALTVRDYLNKFRCLYVADESTSFKTPNAKVTKRVLASSKYAAYRRVLNGTPVLDSPMDGYSQVKWVDPNVWRRIGVNNFTQFKTFFGNWIQCELKGSDKTFPKLVGYYNLDILTKCLYEIGSRVMKDDVLDLPPKVYTTVYFDLTPKQERLYQDLKEEFFATLDDGEVVSAELAIVRLTRFQQICSGYIPADDEDELRPIGKENPRLSCLNNVLDSTPNSAIIWAKYNIDIDIISDLLRKRKETFYTYDGRVDQDDRLRAKRGFQAGERKYFVAKPTSAGRGLTLTRADTVIYYNNTYSMDVRQQSEDRAHRIGQENTVRYVDIVGLGTVDEHIVSTLRKKRETSAIVTRDQLHDWI